MTKISTSTKKKTKTKAEAPKKIGAKAEAPKKIGRPAADEARVTISFRVPSRVQAAFLRLAEEENQARPGRNVKPSDLYNEALASFLRVQGVHIEGWNA